jgi:hypothetical protein
MRTMIQYIKNNLKGDLTGAEIGVASGDNAMAMVKNLHLKELHLVDIWEKYQQGNRIEDRYFHLYEAVLKKFSRFDNVLVHKRESTDIAKWFSDGYFDFVYIDGCHTFKAVKADFYAWLPKIKKPGGIIGGHDYTGGWQDVINAVNECVAELRGHMVKFEFMHEYPDWWIILK